MCKAVSVDQNMAAKRADSTRNMSMGQRCYICFLKEGSRREEKRKEAEK